LFHIFVFTINSEQENEMNIFFSEILNELSEVTEDQYVEPENSVSDGEKVVGKMNDYLKCLYVVFERASEKSKQSLIDYKREDSVKAREELIITVIENGTRYKIIRDIFWLEVEKQFGLLGKETSTGVRKGFKVVSFENAMMPGMLAVGMPLSHL